MSNSNCPKIRRNASPSTRQGPLRATQQFGLQSVISQSSSPSRKAISRRTPTPSGTSKSRLAKARSHSETGFVSERRSPNSSQKVEKPGALRAGASLESINLYLSGQWPKDGASTNSTTLSGSKLKLDSGFSSPYSLSNVSLTQPHSHHHSYYCDGVKDAQTQTPEEWDTGSTGSGSRFVIYKRPPQPSNTVNEHWNLKSKDIKARLQRKDSSSRTVQAASQRFSPITASLSPHHSGSGSSSSQPIKIPTSSNPPTTALRGTPGKARASVEGLNQEVEKLIISAAPSSSVPVSGSLVKCAADELLAPNCLLFEYPDGHRAPVPGLLAATTRNADTQTPCSQSDEPLTLGGGDCISVDVATRCSSQASSDDSRPQSVSPSFIPGVIDMDEPSVTSTRWGGTTSSGQQQERPSASPKPRNEFVRLPPDGAEKIRVVDEIDSIPRMKNFLTPIASKVLQPSERSAFQSPIKKPTAVSAGLGGQRSSLLDKL